MAGTEQHHSAASAAGAHKSWLPTIVVMIVIYCVVAVVWAVAGKLAAFLMAVAILVVVVALDCRGRHVNASARKWAMAEIAWLYLKGVGIGVALGSMLTWILSALA